MANGEITPGDIQAAGDGDGLRRLLAPLGYDGSDPLDQAAPALGIAEWVDAQTHPGAQFAEMEQIESHPLRYHGVQRIVTLVFFVPWRLPGTPFVHRRFSSMSVSKHAWRRRIGQVSVYERGGR